MTCVLKEAMKRIHLKWTAVTQEAGGLAQTVVMKCVCFER